MAQLQPYKKQTQRASTPAATPGLAGARSLAYRVLAKPEDYPSEFLAWLPRFLNQNANFTITATQLPAVEKRNIVGVTQNAQFANSWVNFSGTAEPAHYYKDPFGRVFVGGSIKSGTLGLAAFTLPAGYRPQEQLIFAVVSNGAFGLVVINTDGTVVPTTGSNVSFSLSGINFRQFA